MQGDGNGWVSCALGHSHWGRHGAAGLLLHAVDDGGVVRVLLQHRARWSHFGGTWGLPGGARDSHEDPVTTALREAVEETGLASELVRARHVLVDDHGGWSYTTVHADARAPLPLQPNWESAELDWVALDAVSELALHPGFAVTWPALRAEPVTLLVDVANVIGSRPDGWWRDRAGASSRLLSQADELRGVTVRGTQGETWIIHGVLAVLEGAARAAPDPQWVQVLRTTTGEGSGDDLLVSIAAAIEGQGTRVAVSADRGLRARLAGLGVAAGELRCVGPGWLLDVLAS